ncbi:MAG TPA: hypothetical protein PKW98_05735 [Candidatus Wallbacteria bacterium]|nr:hypothetical protein [Candidatus Wallbacteria bacterium]HPG57299.1 hypothetical protein [Candidatus Wallbacteria bacterium]
MAGGFDSYPFPLKKVGRASASFFEKLARVNFIKLLWLLFISSG